MMEHAFTPTILRILREEFGTASTEVFEKSLLLQYLNFKTRSANRGSKARGAYASLYALYILAEDYVNKGYVDASTYETYEGAQYSDLFRRMRELPFGSKLQNHALNTRLNGEFLKFFPTSEHEPVLRNLDTKRYWINEHLLLILTSNHVHNNIARSIVRIIDAYIEAKKDAFASFLADCKQIEMLRVEQPEEARRFIEGLIRPNVDARLFEIVSFAILKAYYGEQSIHWGWQRDSIHEEFLMLYKTGRTNANDGGIDFVMKPIGRFFQVTETLDVNKYFLDIEKVQRFPLTFVVNSVEPVDEIRSKMRLQARRKYPVQAIVDRYMSCIEEIINIPDLLARFDAVVKKQASSAVMSEIIVQSKVEFNIDDFDEAEIDAMDDLPDAEEDAPD